MDASNSRVIQPVQASASASSAATEVLVAPDNEIVIKRLINAPREMVFDARLSHEHLSQWYGPEGFTITTHEINVKSGGVWRFTMHGPDGMDYLNRVDYVKVVRPELITHQHRGEGADAEVSFEIVTTFVAVGNKTEITMRSIFPSAAAKDFVVKTYGAIEGGKQTLGRLAAFAEAGC